MSSAALALLLTALAIRAQEQALEPGGPGAFSDLSEMEMSLHHRAVAHWGMGMHETAAREFGELLESRPGRAVILLNLGLLRLSQRELAAAGRALEDALAAAPESARARYLLGRCRLAAGRPAEAVELLRRAAALDPREPAVAFRLSEALLAAGRDPEAQEELRRVLELNPRHAAALSRLGRLLEASGRGSEAAALFSRRAAVGLGEGRRSERGRYDRPLEPVPSEEAAPGVGEGRWLEVRAVGKGAGGPAVVTVMAGRLVLRRSARQKPERFSLGARSRVDAVKVDWPDGAHAYRLDVDAGQTIVLSEIRAHVW